MVKENNDHWDSRGTHDPAEEKSPTQPPSPESAVMSEVAPEVGRQKTSVRSIPGMMVVFWSMLTGLACFGLLLPVVPLAVIEAGNSARLAGMVTAVMMVAAVATQLMTPKLLRLFTYRAVVVGSALLLAVPALGYLVSMSPEMVLAMTAIRGIGFGAICVALYALTAQIAPEGMLGKASGLTGVASGAGQMIALPLGLAITDSALGFTGAYITCCICGVLAAGIAMLVPNPQPTVLDEEVEMNPQDPVRVVVDSQGQMLDNTEAVMVDQAEVPAAESFTHGPIQHHRPRRVRLALNPKHAGSKAKNAAKRAAKGTRAGVQKVTHLRPGKVVTRIYRRPRPNGLIVTLVPAVVLGCCSLGYGSVTTFLPAAVKETDAATGATLAGIMLSIVSGAVVLLRLISGAISDKLQRPGALMIPGIFLGVSGLLLVVAALTVGGGGALTITLLVAGAVLFGAGFGTIQNEAMMEMFIRMPRDKIDQASTVWNASFDAGTAVGSVILGIVAAAFGFVGAFIAAAALVGFGFVMEIGERLTTKQHER